MSRIAPSELFPARAGAPAFRVVDVRAPVEVARGALPGSVQEPILTDEERHAVGLRYAEAGQAAAVALGEELTRCDLPRRIAAWRKAAADGPVAFLCWRGGMRSELAHRFAGLPDAVRVQGGYKAVRRHLTASVEPSLARRRTLVVTGPTGSGKTELLRNVRDVPDLLALDLEGAAAHRGSSFGALGPQPAQATFEHRLGLPLLLGDEAWLLVEDESRNVGRVHQPPALFERLRAAPLLVLEEPLARRVARIHAEYAAAPARVRGVGPVSEELRAGIRRLRRRLGGRRVEALCARLEDVQRQGAWFDPDAFQPVIAPLLEEYYDPLYRKATPLEGREVRMRGTLEELTRWLSEALRPSRA